MAEYFVVANSFAAPFFSDQSTGYVEGEDAASALEQYAAEYGHPAGLYAARIYESADAYHKDMDSHLAEWLCNQEQEKQRATAGKPSYGFYSDGPGRFRVDDEWFDVAEPKAGSVV